MNIERCFLLTFYLIRGSVTRLDDFCFLGKHSKPVGAIILPKWLTLLGDFCKCVKIIHFSSEIIVGQLLLTFGDFLLVTLIRGHSELFFLLTSLGVEAPDMLAGSVTRWPGYF